jgi:Protein of unknown function with HXXEE motif
MASSKPPNKTPIVALTDSCPRALLACFARDYVSLLTGLQEHDNDRFRLFVNQKIGKRRVGLSPLTVFVINVPGVRGVIGISLALAATVSAGFGLIAVYLVLLNGTIHVVQAVISRGYNPGLGTAIALFLPLGGYGMAAIQQAGGGTFLMHMTGAEAAIAIHVAIIVHTMRQRPGL